MSMERERNEEDVLHGVRLACALMVGMAEGIMEEGGGIESMAPLLGLSISTLKAERVDDPVFQVDVESVIAKAESLIRVASAEAGATRERTEAFIASLGV